jgi:integrase
LTEDQAAAFIAALEGTARVAVMLAIVTSMNKAEWLSLIWDRLNLTDRDGVADGERLPARSLAVRAGVYHGKFDTTKTPNRVRVIPLPAVLVQELQALKDNSRWTDPSDLVFVNPERRGVPLYTRHLERTVIKPVAKELGFEWFSWHSARRTIASISAGLASWSLTDRVQHLGHASAAQSEAYSVSAISRRRIGVEDIASRLVPSGPTVDGELGSPQLGASASGLGAHPLD